MECREEWNCGRQPSARRCRPVAARVLFPGEWDRMTSRLMKAVLQSGGVQGVESVETSSPGVVGAPMLANRNSGPQERRLPRTRLRGLLATRLWVTLVFGHAGVESIRSSACSVSTVSSGVVSSASGIGMLDVVP